MDPKNGASETLRGLKLHERVSKIVGPVAKGPIRPGSFGQPLHGRANRENGFN